MTVLKSRQRRDRDSEGKSSMFSDPDGSKQAEAMAGVEKALAKRTKTSQFFDTTGKQPKIFSEDIIMWILYQARQLFEAEPMLVEVPAPVTICGDVHGQLYDLQNIFENGRPPQDRFLFLGDYVDRGKFGVECMTTLLWFKVNYPDKIFLLRGNHETESLGQQYGFFDECKRRYSPKLFKAFCSVFAMLPPTALVADRALCMHGGLSQSLTSLDQIRKLKKPYAVPDVGLVCDLLWADPERGVRGYAMSERGCSQTFGEDVVARFLQKHDLDLIVRAHQVMEHGYEFFAGRRLVTVFSASNYCGEFDNCGAMLIMDEDLKCKFKVHKPERSL